MIVKVSLHANTSRNKSDKKQSLCALCYNMKNIFAIES